MRPVLEVADIFRRHGDAFRAAQGGRLLPHQRRVMAAIEACRTATLGGHVEQCNACGMVRIAYNSCRDRHCPKCQGLARAEWLADRQADFLPVPYFHVVFTVPAPIAAIALQNKAIVYDILLKTAAETIRVIGADPQHLGGETGMIAILATHPIQYQTPIWRMLAARDRAPVKVYYLSRQGLDCRRDPGFGRDFAWDVDLLDGYEHEFARVRERRRQDSFFWLSLCENLPQRMKAEGARAV